MRLVVRLLRFPSIEEIVEREVNVVDQDIKIVGELKAVDLVWSGFKIMELDPVVTSHLDRASKHTLC
jgi:hypothetical protein